MRALILSFLLSCAHVCATDYDIPSSIRFSLNREASASPLVYYFSSPELLDNSYPILVLCDGSESKEDLRSVFFIRDYFAERMRSLNVGYLTVEKWGIDGNTVDEAEFWSHYTCSQRLSDHLQVIRHFEEHPPRGWNGQWIFVGVSEGGPLVTDLSILCSNTLATINWVGAVEESWADQFWHFFEYGKKKLSWDCPPDLPTTRREFDLLAQQIIAHPTPDLWLGGMTYLYHADALQKPPIDYSKIRAPFLAVVGTEDSLLDSCDAFVEKALAAGAPITYFRVDGMDHYIRKKPEIIDRSFEWLKKQYYEEHLPPRTF